MRSKKMTRWIPYQGIPASRMNLRDRATRSQAREAPERDKIHLPLMRLAFNHPICKYYLIHIANERRTTPWQGALLKRMGVKAGVSDLWLGYPNKRYHGYWIELKWGENKMTPSQKDWFKLREAVGDATGCFTDYRTAWNSILEYLGEAPHFLIDL